MKLLAAQDYPAEGGPGDAEEAAGMAGEHEPECRR